MRAWLKKLLKDEQGQSSVEYMLILMIGVMLALRFKKALLNPLTKAAENVGGKIEEISNQPLD
jgi:Flp pilus assembly pilin Flp